MYFWEWTENVEKNWYFPKNKILYSVKLISGQTHSEGMLWEVFEWLVNVTHVYSMYYSIL